MADLKFRTGASASVTKEKSLEEKLAGIIGTSTGAIKSLETQLRREREAEEARKKAEEEARKRAEAAAAANTAARTEADNKARLADLLTAANRAGVAQSSKNAKMVAFGEGETGAYTTKPTTTVREQKVKPNLPTLPTVNTPVATPPAKGDVKAVTLEDQYGVNVDEDAMRTRLEEMERELNTAGRLGDQAKVKELGSGVNALRKALGAREETAKIEERNAQKRAASAAAEAAQQAELDRFQKYDAMDAGQMEGQIRELENRLQVVEDSIAANDRKALEAYRRGEMIEYNRYENERVRLTQMRDALEDELRALNDAYAQKAQFDQEYSAHDKMMMRNVGVAQTRMDVAADAAQKNAAYIQAQGVKLGQLETKIKTFAGDPSSPEYAALINEYNVAADLYNQAIALSSRHDAQLVDSIGAYYDALDARGTLDPVYQQSYEKAIGLTAQIDGLQRQLDELYLQQKAAAEAGNTGAAEVLNQQISAIDEQIMALMKERAPLADYAYTYDMTRTLDELPENDLYLFRSVASEDYSAFTAGVGNPEQARAQLLEKYSEKEFDRILGYVQRQYNAEKAAQRQEKYEQLSSTFGGAVLATVASVVTNVIGAPGAVYEIVKQGLENSGTMTPYDTNAAGFWAQNATRGLRGAVSEQINNPVGEFVYQTLTSAIDSAAAMALAGASGGVLLGVSAAANSMQDIAERGGDLGQIVAGGVMAGVFEGLFEQYSIGNFYALKDVPTTTYRDMARNILTSAGVNAQEEAATELANIMYDFIALGDASNYAIRLRELMTQDGLTEAQAKKALAMESATQIALAAASGALMGVGFGATGSVDSYIRVRRGEVVQPDDTEVFRSYMTTRTIAAAYLPADRRPNMSYVSGRTTQDDVEYYAQIVLDRMKEENRKAQQEREADREAAQLRAEQEQERAEIKVRTLQTAAEVAETAVQAETSANTDAAQTQQEPVAAAPVQQAETAAVMPQEVRNVRTVSNVQTAQNTPVSFDTDDVSAFVVEEAAEIYESLSMNEGTMLDSAVQDEARALRQEGREDVATALEQMHREIGGVNYGDSIGQRSERDAGESAGGEAGTVAESAGSDQSRDVQTGREETGSAAREDYEAGRKIKLSAYGIHDVAENQTLTEITDTSSDPEIIEITNAAKLAGVEVHVVREQIRTKTGKRAGGAYENGVIIVSTSDPTFTPTQIFNHELFHAMQENTPGLLTETTQLLLDNYTDEEFDALVAAYQQLYAGLGLEDEDIFKEICADMYAGMVREQLAAAKNANLPQLTQEARRIVREKANVTAAGESDANGTRSDSQPSVKARFSMSSPVEQTDSEGNTLSEQQAAYFAESKVRNDNGSLLVVYHGSPAVFTEFSHAFMGTHGSAEGQGFYFTDNRTMAEGYQREGGQILSGYLDIKKPLSDDSLTLKKAEVTRLLKKLDPTGDLIISDYDPSGGMGYPSRAWYNRALSETVNILMEGNETDSELLAELANVGGGSGDVLNAVRTLFGYDGYIVKGKYDNADVYVAFESNQFKNIDNRTPTDNPDVRFSISDDTTELMQDTETLTKRLEAVEKDLEDFEVNIGSPEDSTARVQYLELQMKKTAIETELHERTMRAREAAMREGEPERAEKLDELKLIEAHEQELWAEAAAERRAWKEDENQEHLANAENLKEQARAERRKANKLRKELGITRAQEYRPADAMQQTGTAILKAFGIPKAQRAQMRQELNTVFERILTHGYVSNNELDSVVRTLYENGKGTVRPVSETHQRIAADLKGKTLYLDLDMRKTYKDQEWNDIRAELYRLGVKTSRVENEGTTRVEDMYELLKTAYPEVFTAEALTPQAKLEAMLEAGQLGTTRRVKLESTESKAAFDELMKTVKRELATFTKVAGLENRMLEETQRTREYYENLAKEARERRVRSELMTRTRNTVKRLARMAERNDALLNKTLAQLDPDLRKSAENAMQTLDFVANRMTGKTKAGLLALRDSVLEVYNVRDGDEYKAEYEMYVPAEVRAAIPALERLGKVQINDLTLDELQTLVTAVNVITENLDRMNRIISDSWDQQLDNAGRELLKEIEENTDGAKGNSNLAAFWNEKSLSPSRALLRLVGYDRSGVMGHVVEDFEQGDRDVMGYTIGADRIFADFIADAENRKWLKTAAGKNAAFIDVDIPAVLEVGKGDKPILDKDKPGALTVRMQITPMMVVQMARDLQNEQNIRHFEEGGYTFPSIALYKKGNTGAMFVQGERTFRLSRDFVQQIVDQHLGEVGKKYVKLLDQYYNVFSKNHINHTSQLLTGEDKAIADSYNPLRTDAAYRGKTYNVFDGTIEGMGSLKSRQQLASSPIMLDDADATFQWHKESIAKYVGYAVPMRNFKALMNYKPAHQSKTIHAVIGEKFGSNASKFITDFIAFVDAGEIEHVESLKFLEKLTDAYIGNVLSFNISSALKQISALATAGTSYGQGVVIKAMVTFKAVDEELIRIYTPYLDYRGAGYSTVEIANFVRALEDARMSKLAQFVAGKSWLTRTDLWVNRRLWLAAEYVVQNTTQLRPSSDMAIVKSGNDPYYKAVAEVFNRMTHDTQTNYNTMSRPMILRSKNAIVRALTMFKTDAYQIQGIAREAFGAYRTAKRKYNASQTEANEAELRRAKAQLVRSMTGILTSSLMSSILGNFIRLLRNWKEYKDEDGKFSWEKFFEKMPKALFQDTLSNITGAVLLGDQLTDVVYSWIFGDTFWEPEIVSFSTLKDLCDSLDKLGENFGKYISTIRYLRDGGEDWQSYMKNHADAIMGDLRKAMYQIAQALGVPLKNIEKTLLMPFEIFAPELATAYQDFFGDFEKASLANTTGEEREAALHAYLTDEVGDLGETAEAEILRLYELYGNKALPGSDAPTSVKELDENGNEIERKPTLTELGNWDAEYRRKMMDSLGELIGSDFYNSLSDEEKLKLISRANEYARNTAKEYAGMPVNYEKWMENVSSAIDAGTDLASALYFYTKASTLKADKDENGEAISGSLALKELALLESMDTSGAAKLDLLEGVLSPAQLENLDMLLNAGYDVDGAVNMIRTSLETGKSLKSFTKYLEQGFDREAAQELYEAMAALEPEEGKRQVSNAQEYEAILASGLDDAEKWTAFAGMFDADEEKALAKMEAVRAAGGTPADYAELRQIGQVDAYLRGVENGLSANTSLRIVNAVAALPELPEGESYDTSERQLAAVQACGTPEEQIIAYAMYGTSTSAKTNTAKFTAALAYDVTPEMYLEARALAKASYDADANGSLKQEEVVAALEAMDLTDRQRAALFQLFDSGWKKNPYGNTADIRDAYAAAKEDK